MPIAKSHAKKSPSQNPVDHFKMKQHGGKRGSPSAVPDKLTGGPSREKVYGK